MEKVHFNTIVFARESYHNSRDQMYQAVAQQLRLLMENNYVCKIYDDDVDIIVIEYEHDEHKEPWGVTDLIWASPEEVEYLIDRRIEEQETSCSCSGGCQREHKD